MARYLDKPEVTGLLAYLSRDYLGGNALEKPPGDPGDWKKLIGSGARDDYQWHGELRYTAAYLHHEYLLGGEELEKFQQVMGILGEEAADLLLERTREFLETGGPYPPVPGSEPVPEGRGADIIAELAAADPESIPDRVAAISLAERLATYEAWSELKEFPGKLGQSARRFRVVPIDPGLAESAVARAYDWKSLEGKSLDRDTIKAILDALMKNTGDASRPGATVNIAAQPLGQGMKGGNRTGGFPARVDGGLHVPNRCGTGIEGTQAGRFRPDQPAGRRGQLRPLWIGRAVARFTVRVQLRVPR